jgi:hypothetical protein
LQKNCPVRNQYKLSSYGPRRPPKLLDKSELIKVAVLWYPKKTHVLYVWLFCLYNIWSSEL